MSLVASERVRELYDQAIAGCAHHDIEAARRALLALIDTLNFEEAGPTAEGFYRLYEYCLRKVEGMEFDRVAWILGGLHAAWVEPLGSRDTRDGLAAS